MDDIIAAAKAAQAHEFIVSFPDGYNTHVGERGATFLPQVWEQLPDPAEFMAHLKRKAGLPMDFWAKEVRLSRYTVSKWKESSV